MNLLDQKKSYCINYKGLSHTSKNAHKKLKTHSFCIIKKIIKKEQIKLIQKLFKSRSRVVFFLFFFKYSYFLQDIIFTKKKC